MAKYNDEVIMVPAAYIKAARQWGLLQREAEESPFEWTDADTEALQFFVDKNSEIVKAEAV